MHQTYREPQRLALPRVVAAIGEYHSDPSLRFRRTTL